MTVPAKILELIERFDRNLDAYKQGKYNETQIRREFIDPFFEELGWDIANKQGYAEAYKDVVHEESIKVGQATKAPDYGFRIGGVRKFFLEAKKPSVNIKEDIHPAYQLRRYAWSAKLPLSILTDFEELAIYDCRAKPVKTDKSSHSRILYLTYSEYAERWDEIMGIFSREAILKGSFDKYVESKKAKRGTTEVDAAFLQEIERWRDLLAKNIALRNPDLSQRELNFSVQCTIDRIIFLRICEDRGIEPYGRLMALNSGKSGSDAYKQLFQLFLKADDKYNSGLFHFKEEKGRKDIHDCLTPGLSIDDKTVKEIINNLYYPDSPYEFSVLPADILGQVYEQFLGKVIRLTSAHRAIVEDKPEVKKAGGIYYTPTYIVDYIVKQTVGKLVDDKKPGPQGGVSKLRVLDPACGSGSFLLGAYQFLLDWHLDQYVNDDPNKWSKGRTPRLYQLTDGDWKLTTDERKRILLNNIYGVDIDHQAVEVTKLSLLLKVLEGESKQTLNRQLMLFQERVLPDLQNNIKCGNSLIGNDFYDSTQMTLFDEDEMYRINAFDWKREFQDIIINGGFDAVIGNPPYVRQESIGDFKNYFQNNYKVYHGSADLYAYFIERGISLLKNKGLFSYIVANKWMRANYGEPLRCWLKQQHIMEITDFGDLPVFQKATTYPCIIVISKDPPPSTLSVTQVSTLEFNSLQNYVNENCHPVKLTNLDVKGWSLVDEKTMSLLNKLKSVGIPLKEYVRGKIYRGVLTGLNKAFVIDTETKDRLISEDPKSTDIIKPFLLGRDIKRYQTLNSNQYLIFTRRGIGIKKYPAIEKYLSQYKEQLMPKPKDWKGVKWEGRKSGAYQWYEIQDAIDYHAEFEKPKIIIPAIVQRASYSFDTTGFYSNDKTSIIPTENLYLLGILNSRLLDFVMHSIASTKQGGYFEYKPMYLSQLPICSINFENLPDKAHHDKMVSLVNQMLDFHKQLSQTKLPQKKTVLNRQIEATDRQIDKLVYELYGLTEEEINIVESAT
ncbi:MAG: Eco57I restriction-modification methylase domain-containing protein [Candidatus Brocadiales bacterium]|nr:Eco57I restriction-modification methylase domain-containing protein [Candidatus Brocadiales bacterium]